MNWVRLDVARSEEGIRNLADYKDTPLSLSAEESQYAMREGRKGDLRRFEGSGDLKNMESSKATRREGTHAHRAHYSGGGCRTRADSDSLQSTR